MANIRRGTIARDFVDSLKLQVGADSPTQTSEKVVLTYDFRNTKYCDIHKNAQTSATTATIYTTPSDKDFYLCGAWLSLIKDATATSTITYIQGTLESGLTTVPLKITGITLTAQNECIALDYNIPIKLARNTTLTLNNGTNVANILSAGAIWGYTVEI